MYYSETLHKGVTEFFAVKFKHTLDDHKLYFNNGVVRSFASYIVVQYSEIPLR